ncbi:LysR family transcriptional regulator [Halioxenophilus aromaticivorans]|uniref:LysR family transcriptional regulator n=1 Tax=Halioxenophilus aromaticivorans TaxID=1306992 RepID=A0AAV3U8S9_9ALTE
MDRFDALQAFTAVAAEGSFTKAAAKLDTSNQLVSKYVAQLEEYIGERLFNRTTRRIHLTEAGEQCLQHAQLILENLQDMENHLGQLHSQAQGVLKLSAPVSFSTLHLAPLLNDFKKLHSAVNIDLQLNDRTIDVVEEGFDLALRIGYLKDSSMIARKVAPMRLVLCASPSYLEQYGIPEQPEDLISGHYLSYSYMNNHPKDSALLLALSQKQSNFVANNGEVLTAAAVAGLGYALQPTFIIWRELQAGTLKILLPQYEPAPMGLYATYPHRKLMAAKLKVFLEFLSGYFGQPPYWDNV